MDAALGELGRPNLRPGQIDEHADDPLLGCGRFAYPLDARLRLGERGMRQREPGLSMPAATIARNVWGESDAGPTVATIFVRRYMAAQGYGPLSAPRTLRAFCGLAAAPCAVGRPPNGAFAGDSIVPCGTLFGTTVLRTFRDTSLGARGRRCANVQPNGHG